jgi:uncharacterized membrane protein (UPF0127 family)
MKNTIIMLDMIWVKKQNGVNKIVEIKENVKPASFPAQIGGNKMADYVLELNAGEVNKNNIKLGQEVLINK